MIVHNLIEPPVLFLYLFVWIKHTRIFYKTLQWRVLEFRARGNSVRLVRRAVISCYQFKVIMWCVGIAFVCFILSAFLYEYFPLIAIGLHYGPCLFNYLYGTAYYRPLLVTPQQIQALNLSHEITRSATIILAIIATISVGIAIHIMYCRVFRRNLGPKA